MMLNEPTIASALHVIQDQIKEAIAAPKCHKCGCLQQTVSALAHAAPAEVGLIQVLAEARAVFVPKTYDCLGCPVCYPAIAANAFVEAFPEAGAGLDLCPTEEPDARAGWPPLPGDYTVIRYSAPVAVCTLNSVDLIRELAARQPQGLSVVGTMHTENLGIERVITNCLANPNLRFLILCGEDTQQTVGHLPGHCLQSLFVNGIDTKGRIVGAAGRRPVLKNVSAQDVSVFQQQIELIPMIGELQVDRIERAIHACVQRNPGPFLNSHRLSPIKTIKATGTTSLVLDRAGYFVVYPEASSRRLFLEHYTNQGVLTCVIEGTSAPPLYGEALERGLLTRLDHAAYLGRELARAENSLADGSKYVQDAAPGVLDESLPADACSGPSCGCSTKASAGNYTSKEYVA
jgi:tetrahydromethanopterin S-methyltransferase subunit A